MAVSGLNRFSVNPVNLDISRSILHMPSGRKLSTDLGILTPFFCQEVLPGDTWTVDTAKVIRMQPLVTPIMDSVVCDCFWFFVPNRLIWNHWVNFMGENTASKWTPAVEYVVPKIKVPSGGWNVGSLADHLGVPPLAGAGEEINALPFRGYALIADQWFRSENLQDPVHVTVDDTTLTGVNTTDQVTDVEKGGTCFIAGKLPDYFTSALPAPQKGPSVTFSLAGYAPVYPTAQHGYDLGDWDELPSDIGMLRMSNLNADNTALNAMTNAGYMAHSSQQTLPSGKTFNFIQHVENTSISPTQKPIFTNLNADLSRVSQFSINELRTAFAVQRYYERLARGGSRYIEILKSLFGTTSPDARLQRAEYLGGCRIPLNVSDNQQTSATESGLTPQGNLTGVSYTGNVNSDFSKSFTEHGYIFGLMCARVERRTYQQGLPRHFRRNTVWSYYNPIFANLGEQDIRQDEIYFDTGNHDTVFGYQECWAEYRFIPSSCSGEMRSVATTSLDSWHLADYYASSPSLSSSWIQEDKSNLDRCLAVTSAVSNQIIADFWIDAKVARPMPLYSIPGLIDHH